MKRMIISPDTIVISNDGIWVYPPESPAFRFDGNIQEFIYLLIDCKQIDIDWARFRVRNLLEVE